MDRGPLQALRQERTGIRTKEYMLRRHLYPALGDLPLDQVTTERVARLCAGSPIQPEDAGRTSSRPWRSSSGLRSTGTCSGRCPARSRSPRRPALRQSSTSSARCVGSSTRPRQIDARTHALVLVGLHGGLRRRRNPRPGVRPTVSANADELVVRRNVILALCRHAEERPRPHPRALEPSSPAALERHRASVTGRPGRPRTRSRTRGQPTLAQHLYKWMDAALDKAGIPRQFRVSLHIMRHSACSALAALGVPMIAIRALACHETPQTTAKYMHLAPGVQAAAVRLFDGPNGPSRGTGVATIDPESEKGHFPGEIEWSNGGSNPGPPHCERGALPAELLPQKHRFRARRRDRRDHGRGRYAAAS